MKNVPMTPLNVILSIFIAVLLNHNLFAQSSSYYWADMLSGSSMDESFSIAVDDAGNAYATGVFNESADIGDTTLTSLGSTDIFIVKYSPDGDVLWIRQAGGKEQDYSYAIHISEDGYCYLTGSFADTAYFDSDTLICFDTNIFHFDIFIAKYTLDGELVWLTRAGEEYWDEAFGIDTDLNGNIFITGSYWGTVMFDNISLSGLYGQGALDGFDIFTAKYDSDGNALWAKRMVEQGWDRGSDVTTDPAGNCYVTGGFQSGLRLGGFDGPLMTATGGGGDEDIFLVKYDSDGEIAAYSAAGGEGLDQARAITFSGDHHLYLTGVFNDTALFDTTDMVISHGLMDIFLAKYDTSGNIVWVRGAGGPGEDGANDVAADTEGNSYICGYISGPAYFGDLLVTGSGLFMAKYDPDGHIQWVKQIPEIDNLAKSLDIIPSGDLVVTGVFQNTATFGSTVLNGQGDYDIFITKLDTVTISSITDKSSPLIREFHLDQNYPNPFNPSTAIGYRLSAVSRVELVIYNLLGQRVATLIDEKQAAGEYRITWNAADYPSGVYYYQLTAGDFREVKKMILLR